MSTVDVSGRARFPFWLKRTLISTILRVSMLLLPESECGDPSTPRLWILTDWECNELTPTQIYYFLFSWTGYFFPDMRELRPLRESGAHR